MTDDLLAQHLKTCHGRVLKSSKTINGVLWLEFEDSGSVTKLAFTTKNNSFVSSSTTPVKKVKSATRSPIEEKERALKNTIVSAPKGAKPGRTILRTGTTQS